MKNLKKKGFTIVELVIVIAVIAILSAVLIPTFSSLIKKANLSADQQAVKELNNGLIIGSIEADPQNIDDVANALNEAGYNSFEALSPISKGYNFYWLKSTNQIVLVEVETNEIAFAVKGDEVDFAAELAAGNAFNLKRVAGEVEAESSDDFREAVSKGQSVTLSSDLDLDLENIRVGKGEDVVLDLNGNNVTVGYKNSGKDTRHEYAIDNYGTVTIKNGTIEARGVQNFGTMYIEEGTVIKALDSNGGACVWNENGKLVINGGEFYAPESNSNTSGASLITNKNGEVVINGGTFNTDSNVYAINNDSGKLTINNMTLNAKRGGIGVHAGEALINNCTVINDVSSSGYALYVQDAVVEVKGGSYTNANQNGYAIYLKNVENVNYNGLFELVSGNYYKMK